MGRSWSKQKQSSITTRSVVLFRCLIWGGPFAEFNASRSDARPRTSRRQNAPRGTAPWDGSYRIASGRKFRSAGAKIADRREATASIAAPGQAVRRRSCGDCGGSKGALGEDQARNRDASPAAGAAGIRSATRTPRRRQAEDIVLLRVPDHAIHSSGPACIGLDVTASRANERLS